MENPADLPQSVLIWIVRVNPSQRLIHINVSGNLNQNRQKMNIFKKLFGKSNQDTFESKNENPNLKKPENLDDLNTRIINLDNYIL